MTVATHDRIRLSESLERLIDSRLDTIDRMCWAGWTAGSGWRLCGEVESQVHELLGECETEELSREDVLAVLARLTRRRRSCLKTSRATSTRRPAPVSQPARSVRPGQHRVARTSGILGLTALSSVALLVISYFFNMIFDELFGYVGAAFSCLGLFTCGPLGLALGLYVRKSGVWAFLGIVASGLAMLLGILIATGVVLLA